VVDHWPELLLGVDATLVGIELRGCLKTARDGAILEKLSLHLVGTGEAVVVGNVIPLVVGYSPAL